MRNSFLEPRRYRTNFGTVKADAMVTPEYYEQIVNYVDAIGEDLVPGFVR